MVTKRITASIKAGASLSTVLSISNVQLLALQVPAAWTAADITLQVSPDADKWYDVYSDAGDEVAIKASAGRHVTLSLQYLAGVQYARLRSGTSGTPVNQVADAEINCFGTVID